MNETCESVVAKAVASLEVSLVPCHHNHELWSKLFIYENAIKSEIYSETKANESFEKVVFPIAKRSEHCLYSQIYFRI